MNTPTLEQHRQALHAAQAEAAQHRASAYVDYQPTIAGLRINRPTLDTLATLRALESPLLLGGPVELADLFAFLWVHHPRFHQEDHGTRRASMRTMLRALTPRRLHLNHAARLMLPILRTHRGWKRFAWAPLRWLLTPHLGPNESELRATAIDEATTLLAEALAQFPTGEADAEPIPYALHAQILNLMRRELGLPFHETRRLPLDQLAQHLREIIHHHTPAAPLHTPAEAAVWRDYLGSLNPVPVAVSQ